jgi:hypothetical protein
MQCRLRSDEYRLEIFTTKKLPLSLEFIYRLPQNRKVRVGVFPQFKKYLKRLAAPGGIACQL